MLQFLGGIPGKKSKPGIPLHGVNRGSVGSCRSVATSTSRKIHSCLAPRRFTGCRSTDHKAAKNFRESCFHLHLGALFSFSLPLLRTQTSTKSAFSEGLSFIGRHGFESSLDPMPLLLSDLLNLVRHVSTNERKRVESRCDAIKVRVGPSLRVQTPAIRVQSGAVRDHQASGFLLESPCRSYRLSS